MTRKETIQKIVDHFVANGEDREYVENAFNPPYPLWASFMMLEALGLVKCYDDDDPPTP